MKPKSTLKKVLGFQFSQSPYAYPGCGRNIWKLECGHERVEKTSVPIPKRAHCRDCDYEEARRMATT